MQKSTEQPNPPLNGRRLLAARLQWLGSALLSDVLDEAGFPHQVLHRSLAPLSSSAGFCGPARCLGGGVKVAVGSEVAPGGLLTPYAMASEAVPGSVTVLSAGGFDAGAVLGGMLARDLQSLGVLGLVTDGLVRDREEINVSTFPVVCAGVTPVNGARRWSIVSIGEPIALPGQHGGGVSIRDADLILSDSDGAIVVPQAIAQDVAQMGEELARREAEIEQLRSGENIARLAEARTERFSHIRWLRS
uniref:RraA family protein n=1 Tax=Marinobacterium profundum TaxID=1714300 RepID=UPI000834B596|nr:RraA family protein [Marinobacterium profundum]